MFEIENEKAPQLRTEKCRVIGDRNAHEKRRASGAETGIFDWKRWILACLREHRGRPDGPFVNSQMLRVGENQAPSNCGLSEKIGPQSHRGRVKLQPDGETDDMGAADAAGPHETGHDVRA